MVCREFADGCAIDQRGCLIVQLAEIEMDRMNPKWQPLDLKYHYHPESTVSQLFIEAAVSFPEKVALVSDEGTATYAHLLNYAQSVSELLRLKHDIQPGVSVGIAAGRSFATVGCILGILMTGAAYVPFDVAGAPAALLQRQVVDSGVDIILCDEANTTQSCSQWWGRAKLLPLPRFFSSFMPLAALSGVEESASSPAYIMFTSGSTGVPKGVIVPHRAVVRLVSAQTYLDFDPNKTLLLHSPFGFDASTLELWGALLHGGCLAVAPDRPLSVADYGDLICRYGVTTLWMTAAIFHLVADHAPETFAPVKQLVVGGDVISPLRVEAVHNACPKVQIVNGYGPTESTTFAACYRVPADYVPGDTLPIGHSIAHTKLYVVDENRNLVAKGEAGELAIGGDGVALGYVAQPVLTETKFILDPFSAIAGEKMYLTGDRVREDADGMLYFLGRFDREQKIAGRRVDLNEVENMLSSQPLVRQCAVMTITCGEGEKQIFAAVELWRREEGANFILREHLAAKLPKAAVPSEIVVFDRLPMNANGKLDRPAIKQELESIVATRKEKVGSLSDESANTLSSVFKLWSTLLQIDSLGPDVNFFDAGGDSLLLIQMHATLSKEYPGCIELMDLFSATTPRKISELIDDRKRANQERNPPIAV